MDDVGVITTGREGLLEPLDLSRLPNVADIQPKFFVEGKGVGFFTYVVAIAYNTNIVKTPPASWSILWDPQFKGKVMLPPVGTTNALLMAIMAAMLNGGSQYNMEPAWEALKALKPNLALMETNQALVAELLRTGEVALVAGRNAYFMKSYIEKGYPIGVALNLKEGTFATPGCAVVVKNHPDKRELADAFINEALSAEAQTRMAHALWFGPTNRKVTLGPEIARYVISTPDQWDATIPLNLDNLAARREEWIQKYTRALL
jgi:putative spermidine/putrescine transport system substrate-binding protein